MQFSLFFFGSDSDEAGPYRYLMAASEYADDEGMTALWVPERHFCRFGGLFSSPSVVGAALAMKTKHIGIRAGSVVLPLQNPLRVAEEWSIVDNLSGGRVGIAAASGWHKNDFVLAPGRYENRRKIVFEDLALISRLWQGESVEFPGDHGSSVAVRIRPRPVQATLPIWITTSSLDGCERAGRMGFNLLTASFAHGYRIEDVSECVQRYRKAIREAHSRPGHVTLMTHAYAATSEAAINGLAVRALSNYLSENLDMLASNPATTSRVQKLDLPEGRMRSTFLKAASRMAVDSPTTLIGTIATLRERVRRLQDAGVDELACLTDFGIGFEDAMASLSLLCELHDRPR
jgi:natural product biosynthesis luciferase-like monooxygenase protein